MLDALLVLVSCLVALSLVVAIATLQYLWHFVLKRWVRVVPLPDVCCFLERIAVTGATARLYVHSRHPYEILLSRDIEAKDLLWKSAPCEPMEQSGRYDFWRGFAWKDPFVIPLDGIGDGAWLIQVVSRTDATVRFVTPLLVRRRIEPVIVVCSTHSWHAYNGFAGLCNYEHRGVPMPLRPFLMLAIAMNVKLRLTDTQVAPVVPLPLRRPLAILQDDLYAAPDATPSHLHRAERQVLDAIARCGVACSVATNAEFDRREIDLTGTKLLIFCAHSEYWTEEGMSALGDVIRRGTSVLFLSGNNIYRRVEIVLDGIQVVDQRISSAVSGGLVGASYDSLGYKTYAGYRVIDPNHWLLEGTGMAFGSVFGEGDGSLQSPGASGYESDKLHSQSNPDFRVVALGNNPEGPAYLVCKDNKDGTFVVNVSSVGFAASMAGDATIASMLRNIFRRSLGS
jgi:hypothetical protein